MGVTMKTIGHRLHGLGMLEHWCGEMKAYELRECKLLTGKQKTYNSETVYVGTGDYIDKHQLEVRNANVIVIHDGDLPESIGEPGEGSHLYLKGSSDIFEVFNEVSDLFTRALQLEGLSNLKDLTKLCEKVAQMIGNPVIIIDSSFKVMANSEREKIQDEVWQQNLENGYCSYEFISYVRNMQAIKNAKDNQEPFMMTCYKSPIVRYASKIFLHGKLIGYTLVLVESQSFNVQEQALIGDVSKIAARTIEEGLGRHNLHYLEHESFLMDLIDKGIKDEGVIQDKIRIYEEKLNQFFLMVVIDISSYNAKGRPTGFLSGNINSILKRRHVFYEGYIVVLYDHKKEKPIIDERMHRLEMFAFENGLTIGLSNDFSSLGECQHHYQMAKQVVELNGRLSLTGKVTAFKDVSFYAFLNGPQMKSLDIRAYTHPALRVLETYDHDNDTEFYKTLYLYLKHNMNAIMTGKALYIHRNTVKYRIDKICELTSVDLESEEEVFNLRFSYKAGFEVPS